MRREVYREWHVKFKSTSLVTEVKLNFHAPLRLRVRVSRCISMENSNSKHRGDVSPDEQARSRNTYEVFRFAPSRNSISHSDLILETPDFMNQRVNY